MARDAVFRGRAKGRADLGRRRRSPRASDDWLLLRTLWSDIRRGEQPSVTLADVDWVPGRALEYLVIRGFQLSGAEVRHSFTVQLDIGINEQIDGAVYADGLSCIVEAKHQGPSHRVDIEPIAKMRNQLLRRHAGVVGLVFSVSGFTEPAIKAAHFLGPQAILLWDSDDVEFALRREDFVGPLVIKYRKNVELGMPWYSLAEAEV